MSRVEPGAGLTHKLNLALPGNAGLNYRSRWNRVGVPVNTHEKRAIDKDTIKPECSNEFQ